MEVRYLSVAETARVLGRDRSGLYRRVRAGTLLTDGADNLVLVDGEPVASVRELVDRLRSPHGGGTAHRPTDTPSQSATGESALGNTAAGDSAAVGVLAARVAQLEQELQLTRHEQELERARAAGDIATLTEAAEEAHSSAARAHELAARSNRILRERVVRP